MEKRPEDTFENDLIDILRENPEEEADSGPAEELLEQQYRDALAEVGNISLGAAATALSQLVDRMVQITTPNVTLATMKEVRINYPIPCLVATVHYLKGLEGDNVLIIKKNDALQITGLMMGMEPPDKPEDLGEMELSAIGEAMNQMMGSAATAMSDLFNRVIEISPPQVNRRDFKTESVELESIDDDSLIVQIAFRLVVENLLDSEIIQLIPLEYGRSIASSLLAMLVAGAAEEIPPVPVEEEISPEREIVVEEIAGPVETVEPVEAVETKAPIETVKPLEAIETEIAPTPAGIEEKFGIRRHDYEKINLIKDVSIEIDAVLGKVRLPLKKVFSLSPGEVIALENYLGEPVELYANNQLVARGEVVLVNRQFGVKITAMVGSGFTSMQR